MRTIGYLLLNLAKVVFVLGLVTLGLVLFLGAAFLRVAAHVK